MSDTFVLFVSMVKWMCKFFTFFQITEGKKATERKGRSFAERVDRHPMCLVKKECAFGDFILDLHYIEGRIRESETTLKHHAV